MKEEKPQIDPFLNSDNNCKVDISDKSKQLSPKYDHDLSLNFNYKNNENNRVINDILHSKNKEYLENLNSPKHSSLDIEYNNYNPSPEKIPNRITNNTNDNYSPNLQSSLLNFNEEIRETNFKKTSMIHKLKKFIKI